MYNRYPGNQPWSKAWLITFWVLQSLILIPYLCWTIYILATEGTFQSQSLRALCIDIASLALTSHEIISYARSRLQPLHYLICNVLKTALWLVALILNVVVAVVFVDDQTASQQEIDGSSDSGVASGTIIAIAACLFFVFLAPLIYGSVVFHRSRRGTVATESLEDLSKPQFEFSNLPSRAPGAVPATRFSQIMTGAVYMEERGGQPAGSVSKGV